MWAPINWRLEVRGPHGKSSPSCQRTLTSTLRMAIQSLIQVQRGNQITVPKGSWSPSEKAEQRPGERGQGQVTRRDAGTWGPSQYTANPHYSWIPCLCTPFLTKVDLYPKSILTALPSFTDTCKAVDNLRHSLCLLPPDSAFWFPPSDCIRWVTGLLAVSSNVKDWTIPIK